MSLSPNTIKTVKATIPVLKKHADAISITMYDILFYKHPETIKLFKGSPDNQPKILAAAVSVYAKNIDNIDALQGTVAKMSSAHVRTNVRPEHYPMVGESLINSMKAVLGDAATPEIIEAWTEAYFYLTDILIAREEELYARSA